MTFEEFLLKKKIDPVQLRKVEQAFFDEFKSLFIEMGEKSFDHSKKFWFNKLRRANPLPEEIKVEPKIEEIRNAIPEQNIALSSLPENGNKIINQQEESEKPKPAFKPRFKANMVSPQQQEIQESPTPSNTPEGTKPKAESTIPVAEALDPVTEALEAKPRFKPSMMKKDPKKG
jgi:hypothetical protein